MKSRRIPAVPVRPLLALTLAFFGAGRGALRADPAGDIPPMTAPADDENVPGVQPTFFKTPGLQVAADDLRNGDWRSARKKADAAIAGNKKSPEAWLVLGRAYLAAGLTKKAIRRFNKALKHDPQYAAAYLWKGKAFEAAGKFDEAANEYQAAFHADAKLDAARNAWKRLSDRVAAPEPQ